MAARGGRACQKSPSVSLRTGTYPSPSRHMVVCTDSPHASSQSAQRGRGHEQAKKRGGHRLPDFSSHCQPGPARGDFGMAPPRGWPIFKDSACALPPHSAAMMASGVCLRLCHGVPSRPAPPPCMRWDSLTLSCRLKNRRARPPAFCWLLPGPAASSARLLC